MTMKGLPLTYNRDMQEDKEPLFDAADKLSGSLEMACAVVESAKLDPARPASAVEQSWVVATDLAEALARAGTPFERAHQIVGRLVLDSVRKGLKPSDWTPPSWLGSPRNSPPAWRACSIRARAFRPAKSLGEPARAPSRRRSPKRASVSRK